MTGQVKLIFYMTFIAEAAISDILQEEPLSAMMIECISEIIRANEKNLRKASVYFSPDNSSLILGILKNLQIPAVINIEELEPDEMKSDLVLVLSTSFEVFKFLNFTRWDSSTDFIVARKAENLKLMFDQFWSRNITNILAVVEKSESVKVYGLEPYQLPNCGTKISLLNTWKNGRFSCNNIWHKPQLDMNNCTINITIFDDVRPSVFFEDKCNCGESDTIDGIEGKVMIEISKKINVNPRYIIPANENDWGRIYPYPAGIVGDVYTGRSEVGFGLLAPNQERLEHLDLSIPYGLQECLTIGVPRGAGLGNPTWINILILEFSPLTWAIIIFMMILTFIILWKLKKKTTKKTTLTKSRLASYIFTGFLAMSTKIPTEYGSTFKTIFISYICYSYILAVAYQSSMGSELTVPNPHPEIDTFEELVRSKFKITGHKNLIEVMESVTKEETLQEMYKKSEITNIDIDEALEKIAHRQNAHIRQRSNFLYYLRRNRRVRAHVYVMKDCVTAYYPVFVLRKNSPMTKRVNEIISMLFETGITLYWKEQYWDGIRRRRNRFVQLSIKHLYGAFFLLCTGWIIALISFIIEICYYYLCAKI